MEDRAPQPNALTSMADRYRLLVDAVVDYAIFMLDAGGHIASWNSGAQRIKGYAPSEIIGKHFSVFYPEEARQAHWPAVELERAAQDGRFEDEGWRVRKDGSRFWANVVISSIYDGDKLLGFSKVTRDMTDRRRLAELENSSRRMSEFLAMLAHELRNPLAPIRNAVTVLQLEPSPSPVVRASRDMIDRQLTHLTRLVDDLLDVGRMSTGKVRLKMERAAFADIVTRAVEAARPLMDARQHHFTQTLPRGQVHVHGDATRLTQVLQNLLINAAKYTPSGGAIALHARMEGSGLHVDVQDNGAGLSGEAMAHIFELFAQGDAQEATKESGLGIGLTLAKSLVEMHGGTVGVASLGLGQGSTFSFFLPNASIEDVPAEAAGLRMLVVDDNRDAADSLAEVLRLLDCAPQVAYDGPAALALAKTFAPQVALVDLGMPGMDGYALTRALRADPAHAGMVIAAVSGYGNEADRERTRAAGFDLHMVKPVDPGALVEFVKQMQARFGGLGG